MDSIEIICIDDGSTDRTPQILQTYEQAHTGTITVHTIQNSGAFKARATGISLAKGDYIGFCDAGDTTEPDMYATMLRTALEANADITVAAYQREKNGTIVSTEMQKFGDECHDFTPNIGWFVSVNTALWNKLFKAELVRDHITFEKPPRIMEDALFLLSLMPFIRRLAFVSKPLYHYQIQDGSAMSSLQLGELDSLFDCWEACRSLTKKNDERLLPIVDAAAFIHLGISAPTLLRKNRKRGSNTAMGLIRTELDTKFPLYQKSPFFSRKYLLQNKETMLAPAMAYQLHRLHLLPFALATLDALSSVTKKDLKW